MQKYTWKDLDNGVNKGFYVNHSRFNNEGSLIPIENIKNHEDYIKAEDISGMVKDISIYFDDLFPFLSKDYYKPMFCSLYIEQDNLVVTDGKKLIVIAGNYHNNEENYILPYWLIKNYKSDMIVKYNKHTVYVEYKECVFEIPQEYGKYPNYKDVIPEKFENEIYINIKDVKYKSEFTYIQKDGIDVIKFDNKVYDIIKGNTLLYNTCSSVSMVHNDNIRMLFMPMRIEKEDLNINYVDCTIKIEAVKKPIVISKKIVDKDESAKIIEDLKKDISNYKQSISNYKQRIKQQENDIEDLKDKIINLNIQVDNMKTESKHQFIDTIKEDNLLSQLAVIISKQANIDIKDTNTGFILSGCTYPIKDQLKKIGFSFDNNSKVWIKNK